MNPESNFADGFVEAVRRRCGDVSCGTLWWVEESLWIEKLPNIYRPKSPGHPGLSLWRIARRDSLDAVPMLYGSRQRGEHVAVVAADLSPKEAMHDNMNNSEGALGPKRVIPFTMKETSRDS